MNGFDGLDGKKKEIQVMDFFGGLANIESNQAKRKYRRLGKGEGGKGEKSCQFFFSFLFFFLSPLDLFLSQK